jgi:hypothetical protein
MLRDKAFKHWTVDARERGGIEAYKAEWERYNNILEIMQKTLEVVSTMEQPKPRK